LQKEAKDQGFKFDTYLEKMKSFGMVEKQTDSPTGTQAMESDVMGSSSDGGSSVSQEGEGSWKNDENLTEEEITKRDNDFIAAWKEINPGSEITNDDLIKDIRHPLIADTGLNLSRELGIADEENGVCLRATYICNEKNIIQHVSVNALDTGRNVDEIIRTLEALRAGGLTGCSWSPGDKFVG